MRKQLEHKEVPFKTKEFPIVLFCDQIHSPANQGALFRIADSFGISKIVFYASNLDVSSTRLKRTARNTQNTVVFQEYDSLDVFDQFSDYVKIGIEVTNSSIPIRELSIKNSETKPILLVVGNEKQGISKEVLKHLDKCTHIPMYGVNSSMNAVQATAISLYCITELLENE